MTLTAVQAGAYLHHLAFESEAPERLAKFYADVMDMNLTQHSDGAWRCEGPARRMIVVPGENKKMAYAGLACRDADGVAALKRAPLQRGWKFSTALLPIWMMPLRCVTRMGI